MGGLFKAKVITEEVKMKLKESGSKPGRLYGLPKVHKTRTDVPFRPILSTMDTYNYDLSKFTVSLLSEFCSSEHTIKDSFFFRVVYCQS